MGPTTTWKEKGGGTTTTTTILHFDPVITFAPQPPFLKFEITNSLWFADRMRQFLTQRSTSHVESKKVPTIAPHSLGRPTRRRNLVHSWSLPHNSTQLHMQANKRSERWFVGGYDEWPAALKACRGGPPHPWPYEWVYLPLPINAHNCLVHRLYQYEHHRHYLHGKANLRP